MNTLEFYKKHKIIPTVNIKDEYINKIKKQRFNFYFKIGLLPENFKNKEILEFCPGTGYNAYYLLKFTKIKKITLVDINPTSIEQIQNTLKKFINKIIHKKDITKFYTIKKFDYVIIENALSSTAFFSKPDLVFKKMIKFLKPNGSIILTVSDDVALFSERLRYLHSKLILKNINNKNNLNFAKKILSQEFKSHLKTLGNSTRSIEDWVTDNLLSRYLNKKNFSFLKLYKCINKKLILKNMSPNLNFPDYEWYKKFDIKMNNIKFYKNYNLQRINLMHNEEKFNVNDNLNLNKKIINLVLKISNLISYFNENSSHWHKDLKIIKKYLIILSHNFLKLKKNNKIYLSILEYLKIIDGYLYNKIKPSNLNNYKQFWGHGTNAVCIASIKE
jgi:SAM-dependent methyltransferase